MCIRDRILTFFWNQKDSQADGGLVGYFGAAGFQRSCGGGGVAVHRNVIAGFEQVFDLFG